MDFNIEFNKPIEIGVEEEVIQQPVIEDTSEEKTDTQPKEVIESTSVESTDDSELDDNSVGGVEITDDNASDIANVLLSLGHISEIPEDIDADNFGAKELKKLLSYRDNQLTSKISKDTSEYERKRIIGKFNPLVQELASYNLDNPNADEEDIIEYLESITNVNRITSLDPTKDAERIVREYYKSAGFSTSETSEKIDDLVTLNKLEKEAIKVKPKLDAQAQQIVQAKHQQTQQIKEYEENLYKDLEFKTVETLNTGKIGGIDITREEAQIIYNSLMNNEVPVILKGKQVEMGYLEALIMREKHQGNLENVMLATLILNGGKEAINKFFAKEAKNEELERLTKEIKFSNKRKTSVQSSNKKEEESGFQIKF